MAQTTADGRAQTQPMDVLPLDVGFAVAYLDGVMAMEQREIRQQWATVREHMIRAALSAAKTGGA